jgi:hypothetical protein
MKERESIIATKVCLFFQSTAALAAVKGDDDARGPRSQTPKPQQKMHPATHKRPPRRRSRLVVALFAAATAAAAVAVALSSSSASSSSLSSLPPLPLLRAEAPSSLRRRLLATLEGSLAFNLGQASTTAKFKTVPSKGKGGGHKKTTVTKQAAEGATTATGAGGGGGAVDGPPPSFTNNACSSSLKTLNLTRKEAEDLGKALMDLAAKNRTATVQVRGVAVSVGGG